MKHYPRWFIMNVRLPQATSVGRYDARAQEATSFSQSGPGRLRSYNVYALLAVLCLGYIDIASYIYTINEALLPKYFLLRIHYRRHPVATFEIQLARFVT